MNAVYAAAATTYFIAMGLLIFYSGSVPAQFFVLLAFLLGGISQYFVQSSVEREIAAGNAMALAAMIMGLIALIVWVAI